MNKLLAGQVFDKFYLVDGEISTFASFQISGHLNRDFYSDDEWEALNGRAFSLWQEVRPVAFSLIRGRKLPVNFKVVLQLSNENARWLHEHNRLSMPFEQLGSFYLNIHYQNKQVTCVTGVSYQTFVMDKTPEQVWDETMKQFFKQNGIVVEIQ